MKNVFISHHHKDDQSVDGLTNILKNRNYDVRNSSIRVKKENQKRIDKKEIPEKTIKRLLRMKMRWASTVIVVIGKETHSRPWVNWEIEMANKLGKKVVGVFENGLKDGVEIPEALSDYATSIVGWRSDKIIEALERGTSFENVDGSVRENAVIKSIEC